MSTIQPQTVSRVLRAAHHPRSTKVTGRVRGYHTWTRGFVTRADGHAYGTCVTVEVKTGRRGDSAEQGNEMLSGYARTLAAAGYSVERVSARNTGAADHLLVRPAQASA